MPPAVGAIGALGSGAAGAAGTIGTGIAGLGIEGAGALGMAAEGIGGLGQMGAGALGIDSLSEALGIGAIGSGLLGGGAENPSISYAQSPEQRAVMKAILPTILRMGVAAKGELGEPLWDIPQAPMPDYEIPSIQGMMPTSETLGAISPDVKEAVMQPYEEVESQLFERLGPLGSGRGGMSGAGGAALGRYWGDVAPQYTKSLWDMVQPAQAMGWGEELTQAKLPYQTDLETWRAGREREQFPYSVAPGLLGGSYASPVVNPATPGFGQQMASGFANMLPYFALKNIF